MIDHVSVAVKSLAVSRAFYERTLASLGHKVAFGSDGKFWAFDAGHGTLFELMQSQDGDKIGPCHIAFRADSHEQVDAFYKAALQAGAKCNGPPGPRPQYTENYYAAFVLDPDGYNIEAMFNAK